MRASRDDPFQRLPPELLDMILAKIAGKAWTPFPNRSWRTRDPEVVSSLKSLRLTSTRFAYYDPLMRLAFHTIYLVVSLAHVERLDKFNPQAIAPYVQNIVFRVKSLRWFSILAESIGNHIMVNGSRGEDPESRPPKWFNDDFLKQNLSRHELRCCLEYYSRPEMRLWMWELALLLIHHQWSIHHRLSFVTDGKLQGAWVRALKPMRNAIAIGFENYSIDLNSLASMLKIDYPNTTTSFEESVYQRQEHNELHKCFTIDAAVFQEGLRSLARASISPINLSVSKKFEFRPGQWMGWERLLGWTEIDLSGLQELQFAPAIGRTKNSDYQRIDINSASCPLLEKCQSSLKSLEIAPISYYRRRQWPGPEVIPLPNLQRLFICAVGITPRRLVNWMKEMPSLVELETGCVQFVGGTSRHTYLNMKDLWVYLRDRPSLRYVWSSMVIGFVDTTKLRHEPNPENLDGPLRHCSLYLQRKTEWNY